MARILKVNSAYVTKDNGKVIIEQQYQGKCLDWR